MPEICKQKFVDANGDVHEFTVKKYYGGQAEFAAEQAAAPPAVPPEPLPRASRNPLAAKPEPANPK